MMNFGKTSNARPLWFNPIMKWIALVPHKNQLYICKGGLQDNLLQECHDGPLARHIGGNTLHHSWKGAII
jgi:hypothetical protein